MRRLRNGLLLSFSMGDVKALNVRKAPGDLLKNATDFGYKQSYPLILN